MSKDKVKLSEFNGKVSKKWDLLDSQTLRVDFEDGRSLFVADDGCELKLYIEVPRTVTQVVMDQVPVNCSER